MRATNGHTERNSVTGHLLQKAAAAMRRSTLAVVLCTLTVGAAQAQPQQSRQLWDTEFVSASEQDKKPAKKAITAKPEKPRYKAKAEKPKPLKQTDAFVGITIWRLRPAQAGDEATLSDDGKQLTPQRVESQTALREGDQVRLTIEAPKEGHLYVIDREQYADGSMSDPYLIFPVRRIRGRR